MVLGSTISSLFLTELRHEISVRSQQEYLSDRVLNSVKISVA